jgi:hypothetical protein
MTMPNYDPNSDDYHYPPRHEPDAEIDRLRVELRDWQTSSEAYRHDAERAEARVVELEALCQAQHGAVARAERAVAELEKCKTANASWQESYYKRHNDSIEQRERAERAEAEVMPLKIRLAGAEAQRDGLQAFVDRVLLEKERAEAKRDAT